MFYAVGNVLTITVISITTSRPNCQHFEDESDVVILWGCILFHFLENVTKI